MAVDGMNRGKKQICVGLLAHVDAGKTTLSENILYTCGAIRRMGRVDHGDAYLDTYELEKSRGITIFSKQAVCTLGDLVLTLLDTPGHVDFSAEMERTLEILDYAVLIVSGADGVQGHTRTLWNLLARYEIPVFLFVNKMDQPGTDRAALLEELKKRLDGSCVDFSPEADPGERLEELAVCDEKLLETYLEDGTVDEGRIPELIADRKVFPVYFGSALKGFGVREFLEGLGVYALPREYPEEFGARVFKVMRDAQGTRLTCVRITGGSLGVKEELSGLSRRGGAAWTQKVDQIRLYSGEKYELLQEAAAGVVCALTGLADTWPGEGLGCEPDAEKPILEPVLSYRIRLPEGTDVHRALGNLRMLEEEEPLLHIAWEEELGEIHAQVMGEVQIEILTSLIRSRFGMDVSFDSGNIVYKETIAGPVEGVGHFEPLRHYAEVHLLLEPLEAGSGLVFDTVCSEDVLDRNWQRLILTHLEEKIHRGVLLGAPITDLRITLLTGRAHNKHTEGGDFRQATYRAVRQGLRRAKSVLLEPWYSFRLELPSAQVGRAMTDIQNMGGKFGAPLADGEGTILTGMAPVAAMRDYQREVAAYTGGRGRLSVSVAGYYPCHNAQEVIDAAGYDPEADLDNPTGSVFCSHGAGFVVGWDRVGDYMHLDYAYAGEELPAQEEEDAPLTPAAYRERERAYEVTQKELKEIFERTYGPIRPKAGDAPIERKSRRGWKYRRRADNPEFEKQRRLDGGASAGRPAPARKAGREAEKEYLLVDGYNIIFAWDDLNGLAAANIDGARAKLMDILCNYQGYTGCTLILVFDAYKVRGNPGSVEKYHNIYVVYTKEAETADQYIEKTVHEIGRRYRVRVATSDRLEQVIILGQGGSRISAREFRGEVEAVRAAIREQAAGRRESGKNYLFDGLDGETAAYVEDVRLGRRGE